MYYVIPHFLQPLADRPNFALICKYVYKCHVFTPPYTFRSKSTTRLMNLKSFLSNVELSVE